MSMQTVNYLKDDLETKIAEAEALHQKAAGEDRSFTPTEQKQWDAWMKPSGSIAKLKKEIEAAEASESRREALSLQRVAAGTGPFGSHSSPDIFPGMESLMAHGNGNTPAPEVRLISQPLKAFKGPEAQQNAFDSGLWLKAFLARGSGGYDEESERRISGRGWDIRATGTEGTPSAGGYLVPTPLSNAIIDVRQLAGVSRQLSHVMPMTSDTLDVAKKTAGQILSPLDFLAEFTQHRPSLCSGARAKGSHLIRPRSLLKRRLVLEQVTRYAQEGGSCYIRRAIGRGCGSFSQQPSVGDADQATLYIKNPAKWTHCVVQSVAAR